VAVRPLRCNDRGHTVAAAASHQTNTCRIGDAVAAIQRPKMRHTCPPRPLRPPHITWHEAHGVHRGQRGRPPGRKRLWRPAARPRREYQSAAAPIAHHALDLAARRAARRVPRRTASRVARQRPAVAVGVGCCRRTNTKRRSRRGVARGRSTYERRVERRWGYIEERVGLAVRAIVGCPRVARVAQQVAARRAPAAAAAPCPKSPERTRGGSGGWHDGS